MPKKLTNEPLEQPVTKQIDKQEKEIKGEKESAQKSFESLLKTRITDKSEIAPIQPVVQICNANFAIKGDISFIAGRPKSGKTTVCQFVLGTALMENIPNDMDTLNIRTRFCEGKSVVYIDTEQPRVYTKKLVEGIKTLCKLNELPDNFYSFNWREHQGTQNREAIQVLFEKMPKSHLWVIDGITDFISSVNNEEESNETIRFFMKTASELDTTIVLLIHENDVSGKLRGHIGSEAERKCGGSISIKKNKEKRVHWIEPRMIRGSSDFSNVYFQYDTTVERMVLASEKIVSQMEKEIDPDVKRVENLKRIVNQCTLNGSEQVEKKELLNRITIYYNPSGPVSDKTASRCLKDMIEHGLIALSEGKYVKLKDLEQGEIPF